MNATELRKLNYEELGEKLDESKEEIFNLRFQHVTNQLDNTSTMKKVKRDVARVATIMREQEIAAWQSQQEEA